MNVNKIREDFPILQRKVKNQDLIYFDNAATTQKPLAVIEAVSDYYKNYNSNVHRGVHTLSDEATTAFEDSHRKIGTFINAGSEEFIFTKGTTEGLNLLSHILSTKINKGDEIVLSEMEHHSNIVPWQILAKKTGANIKYIPVNENGTLNMDVASELINSKTKIVSVMHVSNVLGVINPIKDIIKLAKENGAYSIVDGAQSIPQMKVDVKHLGCDFFAFSGHKMCGPTGTGGLYGRKDLLQELPPFLAGGDMISEVTLQGSEWNTLPWKYEAGTPNIAGAIGLAAAVDYLNKIGMENIETCEKKLSSKMYEVLQNQKINFIGDGSIKRSVFAFTMNNIHAHDIAALLDDQGIAIRSGHHCAMPLNNKFKITSSARASMYFYNTEDEIEKFGEAIKKIEKVFEK